MAHVAVPRLTPNTRGALLWRHMHKVYSVNLHIQIQSCMTAHQILNENMPTFFFPKLFTMHKPHMDCCYSVHTEAIVCIPVDHNIGQEGFWHILLKLLGEQSSIKEHELRIDLPYEIHPKDELYYYMMNSDYAFFNTFWEIVDLNFFVVFHFVCTIVHTCLLALNTSIIVKCFMDREISSCMNRTSNHSALNIYDCKKWPLQEKNFMRIGQNNLVSTIFFILKHFKDM